MLTGCIFCGLFFLSEHYENKNKKVQNFLKNDLTSHSFYDILIERSTLV